MPQDKREQSKIAEVLATVGRAIQQTGALIAKYDRIKTGLMQNLLTCGVDEHGRFATRPHITKPSPLGQIPEEWDVVTVQPPAARRKYCDC